MHAVRGRRPTAFCRHGLYTLEAALSTFSGPRVVCLHGCFHDARISTKYARPRPTRGSTMPAESCPTLCATWYATAGGPQGSAKIKLPNGPISAARNSPTSCGARTGSLPQPLHAFARWSRRCRHRHKGGCCDRVELLPVAPRRSWRAGAAGVRSRVLLGGHGSGISNRGVPLGENRPKPN